MPVHNAQQFLCETLDSILSQTISDWELLIVDDFSNDKSAELISAYCNRDKRIKLLYNVDKGIISALSLAFSQSKGEFITRMDADDLMPVNKLKKLVEIAKVDYKTVATGFVKYFSDELVSDGYLRYENWLNEIALENKFNENVYRECVVASPNWMVHRSCFDNEIFFNELSYPEDYNLVLKWYNSGYEIRGVGEVTHLWREHPARTSRNSEIYQQKSFFELKTKHFIDREIKEGEVVQLIGFNQKGKLVDSIFRKKNLPLKIFEFNSNLKNQKYQDVMEINNSFKTILTNWPADTHTQNEIKHFLRSRGFEFGKNIWLF